MKSFRKISLKIAAFLFSAILINIAFTTPDSYSFFTSETSAQIEVKTANIEDILEKFEIKVDNASNAQSIVIRKTQNLEFNPIIYFSVEGELSNYIFHINPIKLDEYKDYEINIRASGIRDGIKGNKNDILRGKITANYLNGFICEARDIEMSRKFIFKDLAGKRNINKASSKINNVNLDKNKSKEDEKKESIVEKKEGKLEGRVKTKENGEGDFKAEDIKQNNATDGLKSENAVIDVSDKKDVNKIKE